MRAVAVLLAALLLGLSARAATLDRNRDPVVMTGLDLPEFIGLQVDRIAAYRYQGGWIQIPVQVDERDTVDFRDVYNNIIPWSVPIWTLSYTDPGTYAGPDSNPLFDDDDELVFMAADAGDQTNCARNRPAGLILGSGLEVEIGDPLDGGTGYVYLFETDGTLDPSAGASYGTYTFDLVAGSYPQDYNLANGPNPEDSEFVSPLYRTHFSDRWIRDELAVTAAGSTGVDILDRHKNMFGPGVCQRTEDTFSNGEGAFFANISGPVRSIRSYMGANSGPLTQRDHLLYSGRQDIVTSLRVHAIPGVMDLYDYSPAATDMTYYNDLNTLGVVVDGSPDSVSPGPIEWEMVTGGQGSLIAVGWVDTDIPSFSYTSYYSDDATPSVTQCTGDAFEYATSGLWISAEIPNTDPSQGAYNILRATRVVYYEGPGQTTADAEHRHDQALTALDLSTAPLPEPACGDGSDNDGDGLIDWDGGAAWNDGVPITDPDPQCVGNPSRNNERPKRLCGVSAALLLLPLWWAQRRRRSLGRESARS
jgi:hypothetical protein